MLTPRLQAAARLCREGTRLIDVGCDHGLLCIQLIQEGSIRRAYAADLREGPLRKARAEIEKQGLSDRILPVLCDGLSAFSPSDADVIAICGIGGETIADILSKASWTADGQHLLVLQPMSKIRELRAFLKTAGYMIETEALAEERDRLYVVMSVRGGEYRGSEHFLFSDAMREDPLFNRYLLEMQDRYHKIASGLSAGGKNGEEIECLLNVIEVEMDKND